MTNLGTIFRTCALFGLFLSLACLPKAFGECAALDDNSPATQLLAFLRASADLPREQWNVDCLTFAIRHLEYRKPATDTIRVLIGFLDFKRPLSQAERLGFVIHGAATVSNLFPAAGTLFTYGKLALPELVAAIENSASPTVTQNATYTVMEIFRDEPATGIEYLKHQAAVLDRSKATKLREAASIAVQWCGAKHQAECEAALKN